MPLTSKEQQAATGEGSEGVQLAWRRCVPAHSRGAPLHHAGAVQNEHIVVEGVCALPEPAGLGCVSAHHQRPQADDCM